MATNKKSPSPRPSAVPLYNAARDREQNYLGRKIAEARKYLGYSLSEFQAVLALHGVDVSTPAISKWELGKSSPNAYQLLAIGQALQVDIDYTFFMSTGNHGQLNRKGLEKLADYREDLLASGRYREQAPRRNTIRFISMPVSNLAVSAGTGAFLDEGNFDTVDFPESSIPEGAEFGVRVSGDSMEPVYHDGQIVWVQRCDQVPVGSVGIFIYDGEGYIKVYDERLPEPDRIEDYTDSFGVVHKQPVMLSFNQNYRPRFYFLQYRLSGSRPGTVSLNRKENEGERI